MSQPIKRKINNQSGAAMLISVVFFLFISLAIISGLVSPTIRQFKNADVNLNSKKSYFLAESGVEDVLYRILNNIAISESEIITLNSNSATTSINTLLGNIKEIISLGDVVSLQRKINLRLQTGDGVVFKYGTQAGQGGFVFRNNSFVNGSLYSNGNIVGANGAYITGDAYVAGNSGSINNMRVGYGGIGHAHANSITNSTVTGNIFCKTGSGNNKPCDNSQNNPPFEDLPITDEMITEWKSDATDGGTTQGSITISTPTTLGPRKIVGNLIVDNTLTITDTIYVTGNLIINGSKIVKLDSSFGATSGIVITDGYIVINNGVTFEDSGTDGSYILFLSDSNCDVSMSGSPCNGNNAINVSNNSDISIVNAQKGTVYFSNNARVKEAVGNKIELKNNVGIQYGSGLINVNFSSGPSGGWTIDSWQESE
ncbi:MAG: hypothetical protein WD963_00745 [Candidatus Paceibacterota bacterium]